MEAVPQQHDLALHVGADLGRIEPEKDADESLLHLRHPHQLFLGADPLASRSSFRNSISSVTLYPPPLCPSLVHIDPMLA